MTLPIDIFQVEAAGVRWLEAAPTLEDAKARIRELAAKYPGEYVVLDQKSGNKFLIKSDGLADELKSFHSDGLADPHLNS